MHDSPGLGENESGEMLEILQKLNIKIQKDTNESSRVSMIVGQDCHITRELTFDEYNQIIGEIDKRLEKNPRNKRLISKKIHLAFKHEPEAAVRECQKILAEDENNFFALNHSATAYMLMKNFERAFYYVGCAKKVSGDSAYIQTLIALIHYHKKDMESALIHFEKALDLDPDFEKALYGCELVSFDKAMKE